MLATKDGATLPGWRDFERAVALALSGEAAESKAVFDVLLSCDEGTYGLSCKMRAELNRIDRDGRVTIEVSNSARKFWNCLRDIGLDQNSYRDNPGKAGPALVGLVREWHRAEAAARHVDLDHSWYLVLSYNKAGQYQLHQFALDIVRPRAVTWSFNGEKILGRDKDGTLVEWYGESGGQLKFYPKAKAAKWESSRFALEPIGEAECGILGKAAKYFPTLWKAACAGWSAEA